MVRNEKKKGTFSTPGRTKKMRQPKLSFAKKTKKVKTTNRSTTIVATSSSSSSSSFSLPSSLYLKKNKNTSPHSIIIASLPPSERSERAHASLREGVKKDLFDVLDQDISRDTEIFGDNDENSRSIIDDSTTSYSISIKDTNAMQELLKTTRKVSKNISAGDTPMVRSHRRKNPSSFAASSSTTTTVVTTPPSSLAQKSSSSSSSSSFHNGSIKTKQTMPLSNKLLRNTTVIEKDPQRNKFLYSNHLWLRYSEGEREINPAETHCLPKQSFLQAAIDYSSRDVQPKLHRACLFIASRFLIPPDIEQSRKYGPLSGSSFEQRVVNAYRWNLLEVLPESKNLFRNYVRFLLRTKSSYVQGIDDGTSKNTITSEDGEDAMVNEISDVDHESTLEELGLPLPFPHVVMIPTGSSSIAA